MSATGLIASRIIMDASKRKKGASMATERAPRKRANSNVIRMPGSDAARQEIAQRAYEIFLSRGADHGRDFEDWLQAEREVSERRRETTDREAS
jgi:hypothetical protein